MRFVFIFFTLGLFLYADQSSSKKVDTNVLVEVKDNSGLSDDAVRDIANKKDIQDKEKVSLKQVYEVTDEKGKVDLSQIQKKWEELSPSPDKYDWVQTKSGEWFKGKIKALYDESLEFESSEVGLYTFHFKDVVQIKSYTIVSVNIENLASFSGILRLKGEKLKIIQGDMEYEFERKDLVSFAPSGELERNFWSGKVTFSLDLRSGNSDQFDYTAQANLQRRTADSRLRLDYLGRISSQNDIETANNHRTNEKYDIYLSRHFFWTPLFSEYYTDKYRNIDHQLTAGIGVGYTLIDTTLTEWSLSGGPAVLYTKYYTVANDRPLDTFSPALEFSTHYGYKLNKMTDITYDYKLTYTDENAGKYKHHMVLTFENSLTSWLDLDLTGVWDYILSPEENADGTFPKKSDFQLLVGLGVAF